VQSIPPFAGTGTWGSYVEVRIGTVLRTG